MTKYPVTKYQFACSMENVVIKPLGKCLEQAGLISDLQISTALEIQSKYNRVKFGTILVTLGVVKQKP